MLLLCGHANIQVQVDKEATRAPLLHMEFLPLLILVAVIAYLVMRKGNAKLQQISTNLLPDTFIVFDLETTGLNASRHEIIEVAAIRFKKGTTTHETFQSLVKPKKSIPHKITDLTGITQEMVDRDGTPVNEVLQEFAVFVGDLRLVSFNAEFDMAFLQAGATGSGLPTFSNPVSCALKMARRAWPKRKSYRLDDLASDGQFKEGAAHRALEDSRRALIVYAAAVAKLKSVA
jgi:DNA polymerase III subunit epsilon